MKISRYAVDRLLKINWFSAVGDTVQLPGVRQVKDKHEFMKSIDGIEWENTTLEAGNEITGLLAKKFSNDYHHWNPLVREAKKILDGEVLPSISSNIITNEVILNNVKWDLVNYLMEDAYKDKIKKPLFFDSLICIYESGHIPCGWDGVWPNGNLVVY
ncbi:MULTISPECIES: hypothetical protein [Pectobacterium]|uniref:hypothetical protein n=1 Tax=Pectobacterium TaxID=122277 RepID=UPI001969504E|nr:hypothetical protein [Pectobacterium brasiliense]MBN3163201.1 hypothetical protein [Pectobacterium brasiliense]MDY4382330.1 hypothetical protein [Pectobacterium brasiliense]